MAALGSRGVRAAAGASRASLITRASSAASSTSMRQAPRRPAPASITVTLRPPATAGERHDAAATAATPSVSYGAWVAANPGMTRAERTQGLKEFMQARDPMGPHATSTQSDDAATAPRGRALELNMLTPPTSEWVGDSTGSAAHDMNSAANLHSISLVKQPTSRAERVAQIQRFAEATRQVDHIDYLQQQVNSRQATATAAAADPIVVSQLPAGWTLSNITGMPVFSYGEWSRSEADSNMDRVTAARQFIRYSRQ